MSIRAITRCRQTTGAFLAKTARLFGKFLEDFLFFGGLAMIIWMNFRVNDLFGWYSLGACMVVFGLLVSLRRRK